jgi:uncharacterized repeat protein (TIGR01451 family)
MKSNTVWRTNTQKEEKMMKTSRITQILGAIFALAILGAIAPVPAHALTGKGQTITNTVNVSWTGGSTTATATVTVDLKETAPSLSAPADQTTVEGSNISITYTLTSQANGNDTYTLSSSIGTLATISTPATTVNGGTADVFLGASMALSTTADATSTTITLTETAAAAGFATGESVVINGAGTAYPITGASGSTITITGLPTINAGDNINEQIQFTVTFTSGTLVDPTATATHTVTTTAEVNGTPAISASDAVDVVVNESALTVTKTASSSNPEPEETITYTILIAANGVTKSNVKASDTVPAYTVLEGAAYGGSDFAQISKCTLDSIDAGPPVVINYSSCGTAEAISQATDDESATIGSGDAAGTVAGSAIRFNIGNGNDGSSSTGGTVGSNEVFKIEYQVTIQ